jgi:hypothetical protein
VCFEPVAVRSVDIVALQVGDVVPLHHSIREPLTATVGDVTTFKVVAGRQGKRLGCMIVDGARAYERRRGPPARGRTRDRCGGVLLTGAGGDVGVRGRPERSPRTLRAGARGDSRRSPSRCRATSRRASASPSPPRCSGPSSRHSGAWPPPSPSVTLAGGGTTIARRAPPRLGKVSASERQPAHGGRDPGGQRAPGHRCCAPAHLPTRRPEDLAADGRHPHEFAPLDPSMEPWRRSPTAST